MSIDIEAYRHWKPEHQEKALALLQERQNNAWRPFYCKNPSCNGQPHCLPTEDRECALPFHQWITEDGTTFICGGEEALTNPIVGCAVQGIPHDEWLWPHARHDQRPPPWKERWQTWLMSGGRGSGKTRTGSELIHKISDVCSDIIIIAATGPDFRETLVEGRAGILRTAPPGKKPEWEPSRKRLTFPSGAIARGFSAEEPDRLRGPESSFIWGDEWAHYPEAEAVWDNALFGHRVKGKYPAHILITSTPKPTKWMKARVKDAKTRLSRVSTYANLSNLEATFREHVIEKYEGTRTGRQELYGELLEDVEGALWSMDMLRYVTEAPEMVRIVVSIDPAGTANARSDETGIVVVGWGEDKNAYVLADHTGKYSPAGWGSKAWAVHEKWFADAIVAEKNYGQDMVTYVIDNETDNQAKVIGVQSRRGKQLRAEPMVAMYEKMRVYHVRDRGDIERRPGDLMDLEEEMLSWVPGEGPSPNRVDALVHGLTELFKGMSPASMSNPNQVLGGPRGAIPNQIPPRRNHW